MTIVDKLIDEEMKKLSEDETVRKKIPQEQSFKLFGNKYTLYLSEGYGCCEWNVFILEDNSDYCIDRGAIGFKEYKDAYDYYTLCLGCSRPEFVINRE